MNKINTEKTDKIFEYIKIGDFNNLKGILDKNLKNKSLIKHYPEMFLEAVCSNNIEIVKYLYEKNIVNHSYKSKIVCVAVRNRNIEMLNFLISIYDLDKEFDNKSVSEINKKTSSEKENDRIRVHPLARAAEIGDIKILNILIPISNPRGFQSMALYEAVCENKREAIDMLFDLSDVELVKNELKNLTGKSGGSARSGYNYLLLKIKSANEKKEIKKELVYSKPNKTKINKII